MASKDMVKTATCEWASAVVNDFVMDESEAPQSETPEIRRAVGHVTECPRCKTDLLALMRIVTGGDASVDSALSRLLRCRVTLEEIASIAEGRQPREAAVRHVASCSLCQEQVQFLRDVIADEDTSPAPVRDAVGPRIDNLWERIGSATRRLKETVSVGLAAASATFVGLTPVLQRQSSPVVTPVRGKRRERIAERLSIPTGVGADSFSVLVEPVAGGRVTLAISAAVEAGRALERVSLHAPDGALLERPATNEQGEAVFPRLRPGAYVVRAEAGEEVWELPVEIKITKGSSK